jgi:hypothetical protein
MDGDKFTLLDELKDQNDENGNSEPQQSQPKVYQPPKSQEYQAPTPQYYHTPQPQLYQPPQPQSQEYLTPQPQNLSQPLYQPSDSQNPQPQIQSQDQSHYLAQNEFNTPNQNPSNQTIANNIYRSELNQTQIQEMSSNPVINNNKIFNRPNKCLSDRRLKIQILLLVLLLINIPIIIFNYIFFIHKKENWIVLSIITDIPILIVAIWMIIYTIKGKTEKNTNIVPISLCALILSLFGFQLYNEFFPILAYIYRLIILLIIVKYNMKSNCRD